MAERVRARLDGFDRAEDPAVVESETTLAHPEIMSDATLSSVRARLAGFGVGAEAVVGAREARDVDSE